MRRDLKNRSLKDFESLTKDLATSLFMYKLYYHSEKYDRVTEVQGYLI